MAPMDKKGFGEQDLDTKSKHFTCCIKLQQRHSAFIAFFILITLI